MSPSTRWIYFFAYGVAGGSTDQLDVSVAVNCDAEMMKQISRMTGAKIVKHLDDVARSSLFVSLIE